MTTSDDLLRQMEEHGEEIRQWGVARIGLFGSWVRGEQTEESDIDILVDFEPGKKTFRSYMGLKFYLEDMFGREVDLVIRTAVKPALEPYIMESVQYAAGV